MPPALGAQSLNHWTAREVPDDVWQSIADLGETDKSQEWTQALGKTRD